MKSPAVRVDFAIMAVLWPVQQRRCWKTLFIIVVAPLFFFALFSTPFNKYTLCPASSSIDLGRMDVRAMTAEQLVEYLNWANSTSCRLSQDFGGILKERPSAYDGQKAICLDRDVAPRPGTCLVYSVGISNEWSFDETMEDYGCEVFSFDPSMNVADHNHTDHIHFYKLGLGIRNGLLNRTDGGKWKMKTLRSIYHSLGHTGRIIDYFKMDIEGNEWDVMFEILASGMLANIRQMGIEFHLIESQSFRRIRSLIADIIQGVENSGMVRFDSKFNPWALARVPALNYSGPTNFELAWYRTIPF